MLMQTTISEGLLYCSEATQDRRSMDGAALHITHLSSCLSDQKNVSSDKLGCSELLYNVASSDRPNRLDNTVLLVP
jgi:hypothetical protein